MEVAYQQNIQGHCFQKPMCVLRGSSNHRGPKTEAATKQQLYYYGKQMDRVVCEERIEVTQEEMKEIKNWHGFAPPELHVKSCGFNAKLFSIRLNM